jgi:hypothetical protein
MAPLLFAAHAASARAEIRVEGSASNVHVAARDATVADVLVALAEVRTVEIILRDSPKTPYLNFGTACGLR